MASETQVLTAKIEAALGPGELHPRALMIVERLIRDHGGDDVAWALAWLYAEAAYDLRLLRERAGAEPPGDPEGGIDYPVPDGRFATPRRIDLALLVVALAGLASLWAVAP